LEEAGQSTLEVAQEEVAKAKGFSKACETVSFRITSIPEQIGYYLATASEPLSSQSLQMDQLD